MTYKVVTPVSVEPITTAEAKLHLRVDTTADDTMIDALITAAREVAEQYVGCALAQVTLEAAFDAFPCHATILDLPMGPVSSVTSIKYTDTDGAEQTLSTDDYSLSVYGLSRTIVPAYGTTWPTTQCIPDAVRVRYVTGYVTAPKAARQGILLILTGLYQHRGDDEAKDIPMAARAVLDTIKVWGF